MGLLYDDLFLALTNPMPEQDFYFNLLAARAIIFESRINCPRTHSKSGVIILSALCNAVAVLDIRFLSVQNGHRKRTARNLTAAMFTPWQEFMERPPRPLHENRTTDVYEFLCLQATGTFGNLPADHHLVYLMLAGDIPYAGRTKVIRSMPASTLPGIAPR